MLNYEYYNSFSDFFSDYLNTIIHLNWKIYLFFLGFLQVLRFENSKVQDLGNFELSPICFYYDEKMQFRILVLINVWAKFHWQTVQAQIRHYVI